MEKSSGDVCAKDSARIGDSGFLGTLEGRYIAYKGADGWHDENL